MHPFSIISYLLHSIRKLSFASRQRLTRILLAALFPWHGALACGHCVEDKVAATYDYAVIKSATQKGFEVAYADIVGSSPSESEAKIIQKTVRETPGIIVDTIRFSISPAAVSFAWSPAQHELKTILDTINPQLAPFKFKLSLLRTWNNKEGLK